MDIPAFQPHVRASELPFEQLAASKNVPEREKVAEACRQFEAVLLRQILQQARKPLLDPGKAASSTSGIYDDMINNQLADKISRTGTFGLARSLQAQLVRQVLPSDHNSQADATTSAPTPRPSNDRKHP